MLGKRHRRPPARQVVYRSSSARLLRLVLGLALVATTLWVAVPALTSEHAPPPPVALFVGTNLGGAGHGDNAQPGSFLRLYVTASQCRNPVTIEGDFTRDPRTWAADARGGGSTGAAGSKGPTQAEVVLSGARVRDFELGLGASFGQTVDPGTSVVGTFQEPLITGTARLAPPLRDQNLVIHNHLYPIYRHGDATAAILSAPQWPEVHSSLHFIIHADLARPSGFRSCYLQMPELFASQDGLNGNAYLTAAEVAKQPLVPMANVRGLSVGSRNKTRLVLAMRSFPFAAGSSM